MNNVTEEKNLNREEIQTLFHWLCETKAAVDKKILPQEFWENVLNNQLSKFTNYNTKFELLNYIASSSQYNEYTNYWTEKLVKSNEVIPFLKDIINSQASSTLVDALTSQFLLLPDEVRKEFYLTDHKIKFIPNSLSNKNPTEEQKNKMYLTKIGQFSYRWIPEEYTHSLFSLLLDKHKYLDFLSNSYVKAVMEDQKKLFDKKTYENLTLPPLVHFSSFEYVLRNTKKLDIENRKNLQSLFALKLFMPGTGNICTSKFEELLKNKKELYNICTGSGEYLMVRYFSKLVKNVTDDLVSSNSRNVEQQVKSLKISNSKLENIKQYDVSMMDFSKPIATARSLMKSITSKVAHKAIPPEVNVEAMTFTLSLSNFQIEKKEVGKKMKI